MLRNRLTIAACLLLLPAAAAAKDCRIKDAPPGVRVPPPSGCTATAHAARRERDERMPVGRSVGSYTLGDGTEVRIGGRIRADANFRH
jgi:hypothetical protein